jgi:hypothetical protein
MMQLYRLHPDLITDSGSNWSGYSDIEIGTSTNMNGEQLREIQDYRNMKPFPFLPASLDWQAKFFVVKALHYSKEE